jgi:multimeric flavodoxin WrbA
MTRATVLGVCGSPRRRGNTSVIVREALDAASRVQGVETRLYEFAGKRIRPCIHCGNCAETGECTTKDDLSTFVGEYEAADAVIWAAPVYVMSLPANMKAAIDRASNAEACHYVNHGGTPPRSSKVCGALVVGGDRNGGEELTLSCLIHASLCNGNVVVSGDSSCGAYIGAACWSGIGEGPSGSRDAVLKDRIGLDAVRSVGQRVAEMALIVVAGKAALGDVLPPEYWQKCPVLEPRSRCMSEQTEDDKGAGEAVHSS